MHVEFFISTIVAIVAAIFCITLLIVRLVKNFKDKDFAVNWRYFVFTAIPVYLFSFILIRFSVDFGSNSITVNNFFASFGTAFHSSISAYTFSLLFEVVDDFWLYTGGPVWLTYYLRVFLHIYYLLGIIATLVLAYSAVFLAVKTFFPKLSNTFSRRKNAERVFIFTESKAPAFIDFAQAIKKKGDIVTIVLPQSTISTQEGSEFKNSLIQKMFDVIVANVTPKYLKKLIRTANDTKGKRKTKIFSFFSEDADNTRFIEYSLEALKSFKDESNVENIDNFLKIYISYQTNNLLKIKDFENESGNVMTVFSEYDDVSRSFVTHVPISQFFDLEKNANKVNFGIEQEMHVHFIGFGRINQAIFNKMGSAYQLGLDQIEGKKPNVVHYHIVDQNADNLIQKYIVDGYNEYKGKVEGYFDLPYLFDIISEKGVQDVANEGELLKYVKEVVAPNCKKSAFNLFIVSYGNGNNNMETACMLNNALKKYADNGSCQNVIFAYVREDDIFFSNINKDNAGVKNDIPIIDLDEEYYDYSLVKKNLNNPPIITFGRTSKVYDFDSSEKEAYMEMAKLTNMSYKLNWGQKYNDVSQFKESNVKLFKSNPEEKWNSLSALNKISNRDVFLQLNTKLAVFGLKLKIDNIYEKNVKVDSQLSFYKGETKIDLNDQNSEKFFQEI